MSSPGHFSRRYHRKQNVFRHPHRYQLARSIVFPLSAPVYQVAGTVSGYPSGNGSGITVQLVNWTTNKIVATTTTAVGGGFSFLVYDSVSEFVCVALFSATVTGSSQEGTAVYAG
jgi:hypothetical protein